MTRSQPHPAELRAEVVAAVRLGGTVADVAREFGLSKQTVSRWAIEDGGTRGTQKTEFTVELITEYLNAGLRAMIAQAEVFGDPIYCRSQNASDLAIAHGVLGDKLAGVAATAQALGIIGEPISINDQPALVEKTGPAAAAPGPAGDFSQ